MSTDPRIEAAAKAIFDVRDDEFDMDEWEDLDTTEREQPACQARAALAAADAVMFSEEAIERAKAALRDEWITGRRAMSYEETVRAVVDVLRGGAA